MYYTVALLKLIMPGPFVSLSCDYGASLQPNGLLYSITQLDLDTLCMFDGCKQTEYLLSKRAFFKREKNPFIALLFRP